MAGINPVQRRNDDWLSTIMKGVSIARDIYGIKASSDEAERKEASDTAMKAEKDRFKAGRLSKGDQIKLAADGFVPTEPGTYGAVPFTDDTTGEQRYGTKLREKGDLPPVQVKTIENGKEVIKFVTPKPGETYVAPPPAAPSGPTKTEVFDEKKAEKTREARERATRSLNSHLSSIDDAAAAADDVVLLAEIGKTNPVAASSIGARLARAAGEKGVLTDADAQRYGGSQAVTDRLSRYVQRSIDGTVAPEDAKFAAEFAQTLKAAAENKKAAETERYVQQFTRNYGGDFKENYAIITGSDYVDKKTTAPKSPPKTGAGAIVEIGGVRYKVGADGNTLEAIE